MSADEMTVDPSFIYNSDLADVSNKHVAQEFIECTPKIYEYDAPYRIELPQGGVVRGQGSGNWPIADGTLPANLKIVMLSAQGQGKVVEDHSGTIGEMLFKDSGTTGTGAAIPKQPSTGVMIGGSQVVSMNGAPATHNMTPITKAQSSSSSSCSVGAVGTRPGAGLSAIWLLGMVALYLRRRRC
jgi:MYXO-CTERM domain-containing protein